MKNIFIHRNREKGRIGFTVNFSRNFWNKPYAKYVDSFLDWIDRKVNKEKTNGTRKSKED